MNAYELADYVEDMDVLAGHQYLNEIANMLRQQADRIAELEKQSEPIEHDFMAWETCGILSEKPYSHGAKPVKLYRHPPQTKPLSDEEIIKIRQATKATTAENWADTLAFARAIEEAHGIK